MERMSSEVLSWSCGGGCLVGWLVGRKGCYIMYHSPLPTMIDLLLNYM